MSLTFRFLACCFALFAATAAYAHGPQLQITNSGGKLVTREVIVEGPYDAVTPPKSVYVMPLLDLAGQWYSRPNGILNNLNLPVYPSGPGLAYGAGLTFDAGGVFTINYTKGLMRWDGTTFVDPGTEQIQAFRGNNFAAPAASALTTDAGPFAGLPFGAIAAGYDEEAHSSARFRLVGDPLVPATVPDDGVYLLSLQLTSSQPNLLPSDEYYFVLGKNVDGPTLYTAANSLGYGPEAIQAVPEPGAIVLTAAAVAVGGCWMMRRRSFIIRIQA